MWKKLKVPIMLAALVVLSLYYYADSQGLTVKELFVSTHPVVKVGGVPIQVEVASTPAERTRGLSGRESLEPVEGLLFVFDESKYHGIWMKEMRFPIDVIWVNEDFKVVGITEGLLPESYPKVFEPPEPARYVIETARYFSESFGIEVGDTVEIPKQFIDN